jgi:hypothetical protein
MIKWLIYLFKKKPLWEYGTCGKHKRRARRHTVNKNVQFVLWKAGEPGYTEDYWVNFDSSWWETFEKEEVL